MIKLNWDYFYHQQNYNEFSLIFLCNLLTTGYSDWLIHYIIQFTSCIANYNWIIHHSTLSYWYIYHLTNVSPFQLSLTSSLNHHNSFILHLIYYHSLHYKSLIYLSLLSTDSDLSIIIHSIITIPIFSYCNSIVIYLSRFISFNFLSISIKINYLFAYYVTDIHLLFSFPIRLINRQSSSIVLINPW